MDPRPSDGYLRAFTRLGHLVIEGRFADALSGARQMRIDFPERTAAVAHTEACLLALDRRIDEAVDLLAALVDQGRWLSRRQLADPDLTALASHPSYDGLTKTMLGREEQAVRAARHGAPEVVTQHPRGPVHAAVVALHMLSVTGAETAQIWAPVVEAGIAVVSVESSLRNGDGLPCWDDAVLAERDVATGIVAARRLDAPLVLAGGSQGAGVAARLALGGAFEDLTGFLCVVGAPATGTWHPHARVPGALVIGGDDPLTAAGQRAFQAELLARGAVVEAVEVPGLPHVYPEDWGAVGPALVGRLTGRSIAP